MQTCLNSHANPHDSCWRCTSRARIRSISGGWRALCYSATCASVGLSAPGLRATHVLGTTCCGLSGVGSKRFPSQWKYEFAVCGVLACSESCRSRSPHQPRRNPSLGIYSVRQHARPLARHAINAHSTVTLTTIIDTFTCSAMPVILSAQ